MHSEMKSKKILFVLHNLYGGGAEKMMVRLANQLDHCGFTVEMLLLSDYGINYKNLNGTIKVTCLYKERTLFSIFALASFLRNSDYSIAISALTHINVVSIISSALSFKTNKLFVSERNFFSLDKKVSKSAVMRLTYFIAPYLYRLIKNPVICVSNGVALDLNEKYNIPKEKLKVAVNPTLDDNFKFKRKTKKQNLHPWLAERTPTKVIVAGGRLAHQKGFDVLLKAFSIVRKHSDVKLIIFGEGVLHGSLENLAIELGINNYVSFPGYTQYLYENFAAADLFVMSSRFEGSPNALVEAIASGVKVISTDCPHGPKEILEDERYLVDIDNPELLSEAIMSNLNSDLPDITSKILKFTNTNAARTYLDIFGLKYES